MSDFHYFRAQRQGTAETGFDAVGMLPGPAGAKLRYGIAHPPSPARGTVLLLQGRAECLEKYREIVGGLLARGLSVYSFEWCGQGLSECPRWGRRRGTARSFDAYLEELDRFRSNIWDGAEGPRYLVAHSTGGHLALRAMAERGLRLAGAVLCAPMIDLKTHRWPRWLVPLLARGLVLLGFGDREIPGERKYLPSVRKFEGNLLTGDPVRFRILPDLVRARPELHRGGATWRWISAAFRSIARLNRPGSAETIAVPVTVLVGAEDRMIDAEAARGFTARLPLGRFMLIAGARHEIMMETDRVLAEFWRAVDDMIL